MSDQAIGLLSLLATLACYAANKRVYRRHPHPLLMPIVATPMVLIALALLTHVRYPQYIAQTHWLVWLLGGGTQQLITDAGLLRIALRSGPS